MKRLISIISTVSVVFLLHACAAVVGINDPVHRANIKKWCDVGKMTGPNCDAVARIERESSPEYILSEKVNKLRSWQCYNAACASETIDIAKECASGRQCDYIFNDKTIPAIDRINIIDYYFFSLKEYRGGFDQSLRAEVLGKCNLRDYLATDPSIKSYEKSSYSAQLALNSGYMGCLTMAMDYGDASYVNKNLKNVYYLYPNDARIKGAFMKSLDRKKDRKIIDNAALFDAEIQSKIDKWYRKNPMPVGDASQRTVDAYNRAADLYSNAADACEKLGLDEYVDGLIANSNWQKFLANNTLETNKLVEDNRRWKEQMDADKRAWDERMRKKDAEDQQLFVDILKKGAEAYTNRR